MGMMSGGEPDRELYASGHLTVEEVIAMVPFHRGAPELIAPEAATSTAAEVRWMHVTETVDASTLLEGGEFVLSTGRLLDSAVAAGQGESAATAFLDGIEAAGAVALAVEVLGDREPVARALRAAAARRTLPVYLLPQQVRFVAITEEVHRRIAAWRLEQLETDRRIHDVFTNLTLESAPAQRIVAEAGRLLGAEVIWRTDGDLAPPAGHARLSDDAGSTGDRRGREGSAVPVVAAGDPAGWLTVTAAEFEPAPSRTLQATVLERAAQAVALTLLAERSRQDQTRQAETALLHELRRPWNLDEDEALRRVHDLGIGVVRGRAADGPAPAAWLPVVVRWHAASHSGVPDRESPLAQQRRGRAVLDALAWSLGQARTSALVGRLQAETVAMVVPLAARALQGSLLERVFSGLERRLGHELTVTAGVAAEDPGLLGAAARLDEAGVVAEAAEALQAAPSSGSSVASPLRPMRRPDDGSAGSAPAHRRLYFRAQDVRLRGLLSALRSDERLRAFSRAELEPLLNPGREDELHLLEQFLAHGGNKSALAQAAHLSRPTLYGRLERLERRLGVSLDDPESRTSLHVAVLLHRVRRA